MNSQSIGNCSGTAGAAVTPCTNPCPPRFIQCTSPDVDFHPAPCPAILQCGMAGSPKITNTTTFPVLIASVDIDTTCLCFPTVKIEFSTLLDLTHLNPNATITIQLSKTCTNAPNNKLPLKSYAITLPVTDGTIPFNFIYCAADANSRNCTYTVEVVSAGGLGNDDIIQFNNTQIAALAVGCQRLC